MSGKIDQLKADCYNRGLWKSVNLLLYRKFKTNFSKKNFISDFDIKGDNFKHVRSSRMVHEHASRPAQRSWPSHFAQEQFQGKYIFHSYIYKFNFFIFIHTSYISLSSSLTSA